MTLLQLMQYFKKNFGWNDEISIGKIDGNADRAICFYPSRRPSGKVNTVGGRSNRSYQLLQVSVLMHYGDNCGVAENNAKQVYDFFGELQGEIEGKAFFTIHRFDAPVFLGTANDRWIYEYSIELDIYARK